MRKSLSVFLILFMLLSCNYKSENIIDDIFDNYSFNSTLSNSSQIIIKAYDSTVTHKRSSGVEVFIPTKEFKTTTKKQIEDFDTIFLNAEKTGYCCCPISSYSVHFFNQKEQLALFYVDTLEFKNKIRIFESSFQYSYIIEKQKWKDYLNELEK
ncbi:hypothetical protein [Flavobacterium daemonense]|uniref:hypothetical protein n=1 Tax=Flavobacterium daemonense TaxID=1393049 RepID=UPI001184ABB1|nr:hypothetical protein [Flavobacterium daemonense]KAF2335110.1 hypothetical protein FND99_07795 [Flavobacterium daemonense]